MTKDELIWILIRFCGIFFIFQALIIIPNLVGLISWLIYLGPNLQETIGTEISTKSTYAELSGSGFKFVFYFLIGIYFLKKGKWVHSLVRIPS